YLPQLQPPGRKPWRNFRAKQRFARIYVTDSGNQRLIEQLHLNRLAGFAQSRREILRGKILTQRFWAEVFDRTEIKRKSSKVSCVFENEVFNSQIQNHSRVLWKRILCRQQIHPAGHSQMTQKLERFRFVRSFKSEQQEFSAPCYVHEFRSS